MARDRGHKLKHMRFHLNMSKKLLTVRVTEYCNRLHRAAMESPSAETFKTSLNTDLCKLLQRICSIRDAGLDDH